MPIYLFRSAGDTRGFAYSLDVTGRNIPPESEDVNWLFVTIADAEHLKPLALQRLRMEGYYVFNG